MRSVLLLILLLAPLCAQVPKKIDTQEKADQVEAMLKADPRNTNLAGLLLDYYLYRWTATLLHETRTRLLIFIIENHPDIDLANAVHDYRGLTVDPDDTEVYAQVRTAWMRQVARQPNNARLLANAAMVLRLTDRKQSARWLKAAATLDSEGTDYEDKLAIVYADALVGMVAMDPQETPKRLDPAETKSAFAREVRQEIDQDSILSARTGWAVHLIAMELRGYNVTTTDYDTVAEELLLNAANLDYPKPTKLAFLAQFYRDQTLKVTHKILPKFAEVDVKSKDVVRTLFASPARVELEDIGAPVKVPLKVVIGVDGHVWKAEAPDDVKSVYAAYAAAVVMGQFTFKPVRVSGEPMMVNSSFDVTLVPPLKPAKP